MALLKTKLLQNIGFLIGSGLLLLGMLSLRPFITQIDVSEPRLRDRVLLVLEENGVKPFAPFLEDPAFLSAKLLSLPSVTFSSVHKEGMTLYIDLRTRQTGILSTQRELYSTEDGVVESVIVLSGECFVKKGDAVKKGDLLIQGKNGIPSALVSILVTKHGTMEELLLESEGDYIEKQEIDGMVEITYRKVYTIYF